jgi:hypothetical protein
MFAYPAFLLGHGPAHWQGAVRALGWVAGGGGLALAWLAAILYLIPAKKALIEGRRGRQLHNDGAQ